MNVLERPGNQVLSEKADVGRIAFTPEELSSITGVSSSTLAKDRLFGRGCRYVKYRRRVLYLRADVEKWLQSLPAGGGRVA